MVKKEFTSAGPEVLTRIVGRTAIEPRDDLSLFARQTLASIRNKHAESIRECRGDVGTCPTGPTGSPGASMVFGRDETMANPANTPAHVPQNAAIFLRLYDRAVIPECPQETLVPEIQRTLGPITWVSNMMIGTPGGWLLTRHDDVNDVLRDADSYTKIGMAKFAQSIGEDWLMIPSEPDLPVHAEYRRSMNPYFSPQRIAAMRDQLRERADRLIAAFQDRGECNFIREFSQKFPIFVVLDLLGLPHERLDEFLAWEHQILHTTTLEERGAGVRAVRNYLKQEIAERRQRPRDDYISRMMEFELDDRKWSDEEVFGHCVNLFAGGLDTVTTMLGNIFNWLARNPERQDELRADPRLHTGATEELLRIFAPLTTFRVATRKLEIHGQKILPGDYVANATPVIGQDPVAFEDPQDIRFDRKTTNIALGNGIHKCLGQHLARLELQTALERFLSAIPTFRHRDGFTPGYFVGNVQFVSALELQW
jgi:cytochrome P450